MALSGGMKRRVMIAKALSHEPQILFLDEPTAGVDVELRRGMWDMVRRLRENGVTIILTTHYIEEAQGNGRSRRRDPQGRDHPGRGKARVDGKTGQAPAGLTLKTPLARAVRSGGLCAGAGRGTAAVHTYGKQDGGDISLLRAPGERVEFTDLNTSARSRNLRQPGARAIMNFHAILAICKFEMARAWRTLSVASPVISTALYFVVFGSAIGSHMVEIDGVSYGAFIVPGMIMLALLTQSIANASFGIYMPRFTGTIYEIHSAPISWRSWPATWGRPPASPCWA